MRQIWDTKLQCSLGRASLIQGNVIEKMNVANAGQVPERREYFCGIVAVTILLEKQGIAFRGHDETQFSANQGNLLKTMKLLLEFDPFLQKPKALFISLLPHRIK